MNRVVITGFGCVTPFGIGRDRYARGIREGQSGIRRLTLFEPDRYITCRVVGEVPDFRPEEYIERARDKKRLSRVVPMAWLAADEALSMAGVDPKRMTTEEKQQVDVIIGSGGGGIEFAERQYMYYFGGNPLKANPYAIASSIVGMLPGELSIRYGFRGMSHALSNGCTSSTDAMGYAYYRIRSGQSVMVLTGGADACITRGVLAGYCLMRAVPRSFNDRPEKASRPFNRDREGFVLSEGAWMLVFEELEHARARGARPLAEVVGYGSTCDAYHRVQIDPDATETARAIQIALREAGLSPADVDYVNLHGTSTPINDRLETMAMKRVFGDRAYEVPMSSTKSMIGHPQGASGAAGVVATLIGMMEGFRPPTINYEVPDPECDLDYVPNAARPGPIEVAVCNCIGFGSKNSALIIRATQ